MFHFPAGVDNSGFVGWLASHLKVVLGTGVLVVCGFNSQRGGVFDYGASRRGSAKTRSPKSTVCGCQGADMGARRVGVFFYGLFMDPDLLRAKGLDPARPRRACVRGWRLRIGDRAALEVDSNSVTHGVLIELTHQEVERLYAEPSVGMYRPEAVIAEPEDGSPVAALCFNLPTAPASHQRNPEYAVKLRELATRLGLPAQYVESIWLSLATLRMT